MNRQGFWSVCLLSCQIAGPTLGQEPAAQIHRLFREYWNAYSQVDPISASRRGDRRYNDRWPNMSLAAGARWQDQQRAWLEQVIDWEKQGLPGRLTPLDRDNLALFKRELSLALEEAAFRWDLLPVEHREGIQTSFDLVEYLTFTTVKDYEDWERRLTTFGAYMDQTIDRMREGIRCKMLHPRVIIELIAGQLAAQIVEDPTQSSYFKPYRAMPNSISPAEQARLRQAGATAIRTAVVPAFIRLQKFLAEEYLPAGYPRAGCWQLPRGKEMYVFFTRKYTSTDLAPDEIHRLGLTEVTRLRGVMDAIIKQVGFQGSFAEFLETLRRDPRFYCKTPEELLMTYRSVAKRIDPELAKVFRKFPRLPYGVEPIPAPTAPFTTTAYYRPGAADGSKAGTYCVNLFRPESRPKYEIMALSLHEAVPGHHFQIALAQELGELPEFRRHGLINAYIEGWALYAESLGDEMGLYDDPYAKFGQLTYEMWRAVRLVVDTGIHQLGWTREQAIDFFKANAAKSELDIRNEIDRYISWPGQALGYKIGELKIKALRRHATAELGPAFDLREFHEVVLGSGAIGLDLLESKIHDWIRCKKAGSIRQP